MKEIETLILSLPVTNPTPLLKQHLPSTPTSQYGALCCCSPGKNDVNPLNSNGTRNSSMSHKIYQLYIYSCSDVNLTSQEATIGRTIQSIVRGLSRFSKAGEPTPYPCRTQWTSQGLCSTLWEFLGTEWKHYPLREGESCASNTVAPYSRRCPLCPITSRLLFFVLHQNISPCVSSASMTPPSACISRPFRSS